MSRKAREYSHSGLYHVVFRGMNKHNIFEENEDFLKFLYFVHDVKQELQFQMYAYCLMSNHVHILLNESKTGDVSLIMKKLLVRYAGWFNRKYERSGSLFGNRFKSQPVESDEYLLTLIRYIHQNPIRAKVVKSLEEYRWSSYSEYLNKPILVDTDFMLSITDKNSFIKFHQQEEKGHFQVSDRIRRSDSSVRQRIIELMEGKDPQVLGEFIKPERDKILKKLKEEGFSIRQIERATGVSRGIIARC